MRPLYSIGIFIAGFVIKGLALFNSKLKLGVKGRKDTFNKLKSAIQPDDKTFWFHCASLGEYEQGLPVFEALKAENPDHKVVLSFFSPSGYEVRKNSNIADVVVYLPLDTSANAKRFLDLVHPEKIVFVKYEIWPNFLFEIKKRQLHAVLISAVFRPNQSFFKWYGGFMKTALFAFDHIFTQNETSRNLLKTLGYDKVTVSGDTRFDRVSNQLKVNNSVDFIESFKSNKTCVVFGSSWPDDDKLFIDFVNSNREIKFIIAPHNIKSSYVQSIKSQLTNKAICYSEMNGKDLSDYKVFILDTIGYLSRVYSYADVVYVGGAAGHTGLHNILEPAVFGHPIIIGENHHKFPEAKTLIDLGGVYSVSSSSAFESVMTSLITDTSLRQKKGAICKTYIENNRGAVDQILQYLNK